MHPHIEMVFLCVVFFLFTTSGNSSPVGSSGSWLDKLPSIEVKVKTDGITVRTGPSREEIYLIVAYILLGVVSVMLIAVGVSICVYKCCHFRRSLPQVAIQGGLPSNHFILHHNPQNANYLRPTTNSSTHLSGGSSVNTHVWPSNRPIDILDIQNTKIASSIPVTSGIYRSTN